MRLAGLARDVHPPIPLSVADIFKNPILGNLARVVDERPSTISTERGGAPVMNDAEPFSLWLPAIRPGQADLRRFCSQPDVPVEAIEDAYPCTPLQEGLMAITSRQEAAYVGRWAFRLSQDIDLHRYKNSWETVFGMTPILRTRILQDPKYGTLQVDHDSAI